MFHIWNLLLRQGGHKPCLQTFETDQCDDRDPDKMEHKSSFFKWLVLEFSNGLVVQGSINLIKKALETFLDMISNCCEKPQLGSSSRKGKWYSGWTWEDLWNQNSTVVPLCSLQLVSSYGWWTSMPHVWEDAWIKRELITMACYTNQWFVLNGSLYQAIIHMTCCALWSLSQNCDLIYKKVSTSFTWLTYITRCWKE